MLRLAFTALLVMSMLAVAAPAFAKPADFFRVWGVTYCYRVPFCEGFAVDESG